MTGLSPLNASTSLTSTNPISPERMELREAAQAFEAIFLRQMLASARNSELGGEGLFSGPGMKEFSAMRDEHFADLAAQGGGLGLARSIEEQLAAHLGPHASNGGG
jgi:flagellar protein FlgJ